MFPHGARRWEPTNRERVDMNEHSVEVITNQLNFTAYGDTAGFVDRPASQLRAVNEIKDGSLSKRQQDILEQLDQAGVGGTTWQVLGQILNLHHGKISGALSNLHACRQVFMLRVTRDRCHPYIHIKYRGIYTDAEVYDLPARTKNTERLSLLEELLVACRQAQNSRYDFYSVEQIDGICAKVSEI